MGWLVDEIFKKRRAVAAERFQGASHDQMLDRIAELEATLWPFVSTLSCLDEKAWRGTTVTSKLFPESFDDTVENDGKFWVYDRGQKEFVPQIVEPESLHSVDYEMRDSIVIDDGQVLHDDFQVMATHQQEIATYVFGGAIWMGDIRRAVKVVFGGESILPSRAPTQGTGAEA